MYERRGGGGGVNSTVESKNRPMVIDISDAIPGIATGLARKRMGTYTELGFEINYI